MHERFRSHTSVMYLCPFAIAFSSTPTRGITRCFLRRWPRPAPVEGRGASQAAHAVAAGWLKSVHAEQAHWSPGGRSVVRMVGLAAGSICSCLCATNDRRIRHQCLSLGAASAAE